jgi:CBS domain-containing protein
MRAHQIMTRVVISVTPDTIITEAAAKMLDNHISGLLVVDAAGKLVGVVSDGDFVRRSEIGTQRKRGGWLQFLVGPGKAASEFVRASGRKVGDVMTPNPITASEDSTLESLVETMESHNIKRLPIMRGDRIAGIVTRTNLLRAVANLAREIPDPTADDDHIGERVARAIEQNEWRPLGLQVTVRDGVVHLHGVITDYRHRDAAIVAAENVSGVKQVRDHLCWVDPFTGMYLNSEEDNKRLSQQAQTEHPRTGMQQ